MSHNSFVFIKHVLFALILILGVWLGSSVSGTSGIIAFLFGVIFPGILGLSYYPFPLKSKEPWYADKFLYDQDKSLLIRWAIGSIVSLIFFGLSGVLLFWLGNISGIILIFIFFAGLTFWYN